MREDFVTRFGEDQAVKIEMAAAEHANDANSARKGSDEFRWALLICIGSECMSRDSFREYHGITAPWPDIDAWLHENKKWIGEHEGDVDYLAMFAGAYNDYVEADQ